MCQIVVWNALKEEHPRVTIRSHYIVIYKGIPVKTLLLSILDFYSLPLARHIDLIFVSEHGIDTRNERISFRETQILTASS